MFTHPLPNQAPEVSPSEEQVTLVVNLTAVPSARLTQRISAALNRDFNQPFSFLGSVGDELTLNLHLSDPGSVATEALSKRLLKTKGVTKLKAERVCTRRGLLYAISLAS